MRLILAISLLSLTSCSKPDEKELLRLCGSNKCCAKSYYLLTNRGYYLATDNLCEESKELNQLSCSGSLRWCQ